MSGSDADEGPVDEFDWIDRCLRPLAKDAPEAFDLLDDAAALASRPGQDLILSADAIVEGVHFRADEAPDLVARKLLRVNLSDLAAKGAEPYGYLLTVAWPARFGWPERRAFAEGLGLDQRAFGLRLLGGDTTSTPGPLSASVTIFGWTASGAMVRRGGARPGDAVLVSGTIGDGWLGLAASGGTGDFAPVDAAWLADRYRLPQPRTPLIAALRRYARAAADVSDGLIADAGRIARASSLGLDLDLDRMPLSAPARAWLAAQADAVAARLALAAGGDDYEIVCTAAPEDVEALIEAAGAAGVAMAEVGRVWEGSGVRVFAGGRERAVARAGYRHG
ncbi:MAG: thiamine-phosphate kinase [Caulobacteraceae bacterium]|nr:thiamine-phosphate kinase [Caulobacteraceae bacterium]